MANLTVKWSNLTKEQRKAATDFYQEDVKLHKIVLNQMSFRVNKHTGTLIFRKDF